MEVLSESAMRQSLPALDAKPVTEPFLGLRNDDFADSGRDSSGSDEVVFDHDLPDGESSPGTSHHSDDNLSDLPESRRNSSMDSGDSAAPITPTKQRSPFRNPSSVRAMQLDTTPPYLRASTHYAKYRMSNVSRDSTPKSVRSHHSVAKSSRSSPTKIQKKEYPLVLLHVTLLPVNCPYSQAVMETTLPPHVIENWKLLHEKASPTMLDRGILIPHPREDYDLLEERLLESLELKAPRILKCGHFHLTPEEEADIQASDDEYETDEEQDVCQDCGRRVRDGRFGAGAGQRRWSIKVYASNGLMRAGAWGAAWQEMERVDIEILPWVDDELRRQLDLRQEEESHQHLIGQQIHESPWALDEERRREIYGDAGPPSFEPFLNDRHTDLSISARRPRREVALSELLLSYIRYLALDRRNVAIALLSISVLHLAIGVGPATHVTNVAGPALSIASVITPTSTLQPSMEPAAVMENLGKSSRQSLAPSASPLLESSFEDQVESPDDAKGLSRGFGMVDEVLADI